MEGNRRWALLTAIAPVAWGSNYWVTRHALPADFPLYGALIRALPAGVLLLALRPRLPRGAWWWRSLLLGAMNVAAFFTLIYVSAQLLQTSIASMIMATSPIAMLLLAWLIVSERPRARAVLGAAAGIAGVALMLAGGAGAIDPLGVLASVAAMTLSCTGYLLAKRWGEGVDVLTLTAWQLLAGSALLAVAAVAFEGAPPPVDATAAARVRLRLARGHRARVRVLVRRPAPPRRRHGRPDRPAQPRHRRPARHARGGRDARRPPAGGHRARLRRHPGRAILTRSASASASR